MIKQQFRFQDAENRNNSAGQYVDILEECTDWLKTTKFMTIS